MDRGQVQMFNNTINVTSLEIRVASLERELRELRGIIELMSLSSAETHVAKGEEHEPK